MLIHQELNLADNLDLGANIFLGREPRRFGLIDRVRIRRESKTFLDMVGLDEPPNAIVGQLSIGYQQMVEIAKALSVNAKVLIMDEPTSSLSARETESLFSVVNDLKTKGVSIIYISHRLGEVKRLADRVCVLRDGSNAGELQRDQINHDSMVKMMVGRDVSQFYSRRGHQVGDVLLEIKELRTGAWPQHKLNLSVRSGEIVGVAGLVGAGRTELLRALFGIDQLAVGTVRLAGETLEIGDSLKAIHQGLALVPEDRKQHGLILQMSVAANIGLAGLRRNRRLGGGLNQERENADTNRMIEKLGIRTTGSTQFAQNLSGGNQQKVVVGKWLALEPRLLLLDEPTRGIDVGAKQEIYVLMEQLAESGVGILFVSSEMEEILGMSDRVLVMHEGQITGELSREELSEEAVMRLATGRGCDSL